METGESPQGRDVIVVGASAGGLDALRQLLAALPADLPASLFIVLHTADHEPGMLARVLASASALPVATAEEGQRFARAHAYVAPPDRHLLIGRDHLHVRRGPRENGSRPAIDPLFRSAAVSCTTRVIGVLLTGLLNDGASGMQAIKRCGGLSVVQDPRDAAYPEMPRSTLRYAPIDHVLPLEEIAGVLAARAREPRLPSAAVPEEIRAEALIAAQEVRHMEPSGTGIVTPITCPECHGAMHEIKDGELVRYRCHTGQPSPSKRSARSRRRRGSGLSTAHCGRSRSGPAWSASSRPRPRTEAKRRHVSCVGAPRAMKRVRSCSVV
jgi:two-component system, chemotaxis family, protein-glutamate methylesterase/glutaminase